MKYGGRKRHDDDYDVMDVINDQCEQADLLLKGIEASTESEEDRKVVLRNVINTLIEKL